ncbi:MAG: hypothetical protein P1V81_01005 [Planctomycetota bacterium]|nr:hypothetical protein [Planctomycetota bacterium]
MLRSIRLVTLSLLLVVTAALAATTPQEDTPTIARSGPAADLDLARQLVSSSRFEDALELLDKVGAGNALLQRERDRVAGLIDLRESFLTSLAKEAGRLRVPIEGKHRNLKVEAYEGGVITFVKNKYELEFLTIDELAFEDLAGAWKSAKVEPLELRSYALALTGDKSWSKLWGKDVEPPATHVADLEDADESVARGARVEALRELEGYLGKDLTADEGRRVVERFEAVFQGGKVELAEDEDLRRFRTLRDLVTASLEAGFGLADLPRVLHATSSEMRGKELLLRYEFDKESELEDWLRDEEHLADVRMMGILQTPEDQHRIGLANGALELLGTKGVRYTLPYRGPIRLRYGMQLPEVGEEGLLWQILVYLNDDFDRNHFAVHCFGYWLELLELDFESEVERDQAYYEIGTDYFTEVVVDQKSDMTVRREDLADDQALTLPARRVNKGHISIVSHTDYVTRVSSFEIQGTPDLDQTPIHRQTWVDLRLAELGF